MLDTIFFEYHTKGFYETPRRNMRQIRGAKFHIFIIELLLISNNRTRVDRGGDDGVDDGHDTGPQGAGNASPSLAS